MHTEIEGKWLNIDLDVFRKKLITNKAKLVQVETLMKRKIFDFDDKALSKVGGWVRVRDEGNKITLSYKQLNDRTIHGTKEVNIIVNDFDSTCQFLEAIGMKQKSYQETKRESWRLDGAEVELDSWPWIPGFIEIEGTSVQQVKKVASKLSLEWEKALHGSVEIAYQDIYDVTEEEIDQWESIEFTAIPEWLAAKKIK